MTKIPMLIIDKLEIGKRELLFDKGREFIKYRLCPVTHKDNELVDVPSHATSWDLCVVALELGLLVFSLCLKIFLGPYLSVQMRVIDKGKTFVGSFFNHLRSYFFLTNAKKGFVVRVVPEDANTRHLLVKGFHVSHLPPMFFVC